MTSRLIYGVALGMALAATGAWAQPFPYCASNPDANSCIVRCDGNMLGTACERCPTSKIRIGVRPGNGQDESCVTGAWAQNPPALSALTCDNDHPCGLGPSVTAGEGVELVNKGSVPLRVDLSPDQKLARAYAMCTKSAIDSMTQGVVHEMLPNAPLPQEASQACRAIMVAYERDHENPSDADRAFIAEVWRGLK